MRVQPRVLALHVRVLEHRDPGQSHESLQSGHVEPRLSQQRLVRCALGHETELGYFSLAEIAAVRGPLKLRIERDLGFEPKPLSAVR
ncbi:MAG: DUF2958 domain-containing protein [Acidobacteria bacterium]|nr:DUF2958 domain-containing protein [Acidobacteriota bacterium]